MNGDFEKSGTYPFATQPAAGYGHDNPTGEYVITKVSVLDKAVLVGEDGRSYTLVDTDLATKFPGAVEATRAIASLL